MIASQFLALFLLLIQKMSMVNGSHYRSGIINWRVLNISTNGSYAQVLIRQRYAWRRNFQPPYCDDNMITNQGSIIPNTGFLSCVSGFCGSYTPLSADVACTDYSVSLNYSSGERYGVRVLPVNRSIVLGFSGNNWIQLVIKGNGLWQITSRIDLTVRPDGKINTPPTGTVLPVVYRQLNRTYYQAIAVADIDVGDTIRCRWATVNTSNNTNGYNECGSACAPTLPSGYMLFEDNCTVAFSVNASGFYAMTIQIEDYFTPNASVPMSSTPIQFVVYGTLINDTSTVPNIIGSKPNGACIGIPTGIQYNETLIIQTNNPGRSILEVVTTSPMGMRRTPVIAQNNVYTMNLIWTPTIIQYGPQGFCAGAVDSIYVQSDSWCVTYIVGVDAPVLLSPNQGTNGGYPTGMIHSNHSLFYIRSANGKRITRPQRVGVFIYFRVASWGNTILLSFDCNSSPNVTYVNDTVFINTAPFVWPPGEQFFVTLDSGVACGTDFCGAESAEINDTNFWTFSIANPYNFTTTTVTTTTLTTTTTVTTTTTATTTSSRTTTTTTSLTTTTTSISTTTWSLNKVDGETNGPDQTVGLAVGLSLGGLALIALITGSIVFARKWFSKNSNVIEPMNEMEIPPNREQLPPEQNIVEDVEDISSG